MLSVFVAVVLGDLVSLGLVVLFFVGRIAKMAFRGGKS